MYLASHDHVLLAPLAQQRLAVHPGVQHGHRRLSCHPQKKLQVRYAVDPKGDSWATFQTKAMPANFLIAKGGKVVAIATGCEPTGLVAESVSGKAAKLLGTDPVDVLGEKKK